MDGGFESKGWTAPFSPAKAGRLCFEVFQHLPEKFWANSGERRRLAWEKPLRLGGVAPRTAESAPASR